MYALIGKTLRSQEDDYVLADKVIAKSSTIVLFYSASWSKYCNDVIPVLKYAYEENVKREYGITIINVPCDETRNDMERHFRSQGNWYTIEFGDPVIQELKWHFQITFIPSIVVLTSSGELISRDGYREILDYNKNVLIAWTYDFHQLPVLVESTVYNHIFL